MSVRVMSEVFAHAEASGNDRVVLLVLADHANDDGSSAYPSHATIARKARCSERTVRDCLSRLRKSGEIEREGLHPKAKTVIYRVTVTPADFAAPGEQTSVTPAESRQTPRQPSADNPSLEPSKEPSSLLPSPEQEVFDFWRQTFELNGNAKLTPDRRRVIAARIREGATVDEIKRAILGCKGSDFHVEGGHIDLTLICRNRSKLEAFLRRPPPASEAMRRVTPLPEGGGVPEISVDGGKTWRADYGATAAAR